MLNLDKLLKEISCIEDRLFPSYENSKFLINMLWNNISSNLLFNDKVTAISEVEFLPTWKGKINQVYSIKDINNYSVLALDGSQIYPDRNLPIGECFLINIGGILLEYSKEAKVRLFSKPKIFLPEDLDDSLVFSKDIVDSIREELEFSHALEFSLQNWKSNIPFLCMFDGSLIFWHLESKMPQIKTTFLKKYLNLLQMFYEHRVPIAGYISFPKSKELLSLLRFEYIENFRKYSPNYSVKDIENGLDIHIISSYLKEGERSAIFFNNSKISCLYPPNLKPCFFYLHAGEEIGRVEVPFWVTEDENLLEMISTIILDQCKKGYGYPICLAEAHEQAVIKSSDRDLFYQILSKYLLNKKLPFLFSQKSLKKRRMGI